MCALFSWCVGSQWPLAQNDPWAKETLEWAYSCCCLLAQSCPTLCDPMDCSPPGSCVQGISQARILEWVVISFSRGSFWRRDGTDISCIDRWIPYSWATSEACILLHPSLKSSLKKRRNFWLEKDVETRARKKEECKQQNEAWKMVLKNNGWRICMKPDFSICSVTMNWFLLEVIYPATVTISQILVWSQIEIFNWACSLSLPSQFFEEDPWVCSLGIF